MKHIKLFEQIASELPKVFSTEEIKNMTQDEFFELMEMYYREPNPDQAFTLLQVWTKAHPGVENDMNWFNRLGKYTVFLDNASLFDGGKGRFSKMDDLKRELGLERFDPKSINDLRQEIARDEKKLMLKKEKLAKIEKESTDKSNKFGFPGIPGSY